MIEDILSAPIQDEEGEFERKFLKDAVVIRADNVANFFALSNQDTVDPVSDFPNVAPPFDNFFIWYREPVVWRIEGKLIETEINLRPYRVGVHVTSVKLDEENLRGYIQEQRFSESPRLKALPEQLSEGCWLSAYFVYVQWVKHGVPEYKGTAIRPIKADGSLTRPAATQWRPALMNGKAPEDYEEIANNAINKISPCFLTISFMHCKNVKQVEYVPPPKINIRRAKEGKPPLTKYYTLEIEAMKRTLQSEGGISTNGLKRALHICRGHFATYSADKPLFGHYVGTVWKPQHIKGSKAMGEIVKDYTVKAPKVKA